MKPLKVPSFEEYAKKNGKAKGMPSSFSSNTILGKRLPFTYGMSQGKAFIKKTPKGKG
jgi:hypothetical protein